MAIERIGESDIEALSRIGAGKSSAQDISNQFEAVFLQSMLKSSCIDQHFTDEKNSFFEVPASYSHDLVPAANTDIIDAPKATDRLIAPPSIEPQINQTVDDFVKSIWPYAKQASTMLGLDPKILMAQAVLETGWGKFIAKDADGSSSHNIFNIKSNRPDQAVKIKTTEYITDTPVSMMASFKKYSSVAASFDDYISLLQGDRYKAALANTSDPEHYIDALHRAGYATDPDYANKIVSIYRGDELQRVLERNGL